MRKLLLLTLSALTGCAYPTTDKADPAFAPVAFLVGCWNGHDDDNAVGTEVWTMPHGDRMYGQSLTTVGGRQVFFELLQIESRGNSLVYIARPRGGDPTEFQMTAHAPRSVTFVNEQHDFPKRIRYRLQDDGGLNATIDDNTDDGKRAEFWWDRVR